MKIIYSQREFVITNRKIESQIVFCGYFPTDIRTGYLGISYTTIIVADTKVTPLITAVGTDSINERETFACTVTAYLTPRIANLKHIQPFHVLLDKSFLGNIPSSRDRRKETKTIFRCKILRTIVTKIEVKKVTVFPVIGCTTGESLVATGNTGLQIRSQIISLDFGILIILQSSIQVMVFKDAVIVQFRFKKLLAVTIASGTLSHLHFFVETMEDKFTV